MHAWRPNASMEMGTLVLHIGVHPIWSLPLHLISVWGKLIVSRYAAESITTDAGRFGHVGLCQLRTKQLCTQLTKAYVAKHPTSVIIDSAMYLLMISLPNIGNVAMSLYDII